MRLLQYTVNVPQRNVKINLIPLGDIHIGSKNCNEHKVKQLVEWIAKTPHTYVIGMGDMIEAINLSDPRFDIESLVEEGAEVNNLLWKQIKRVVTILSPIKHKIIGLIEGNHEAKAKQKYHTDPTAIMCEKLGVEYLTYSSMIRLSIRRGKKRGKWVQPGRSVNIYAHHGFGGGQTIGGKLNKVHKLATNFDADIYLMGHVHDKYVFATEQLALNGWDEPRLVSRKRVFALTGSFFETYIDGYSSYSEKMAYSPIPTGVIKIVIVPFKQMNIMVNGKRTKTDAPIDIHPSV